jgi:inositol phosphorylceramide mannosyltransferase catalytic subunit
VGEVPAGEIQQWNIIAAPMHPLLLDVLRYVLGRIARYDAAVHGVGFKGVLRLTGPIAYTRAIVRSQHKPPPRVVRNHIELGLVYSVMEKDGKYAHQKLFGKSHYTKLKTPIIRAAAG